MDFNYLIGRKITNTGFSNYPAPITISKIDHNKDLGIVDIYTEEYGKSEPSFSLLDDGKNISDFLEGKNVHGWELISEENPIEDTFSNPELFVKEYKDYLIGKTINSPEGEDIKIKDIEYLSDGIGIKSSAKEDKKIIFKVYTENLKNFIDGDVIPLEIIDSKGNRSDASFNLVLQEEDENLSEDDTDLMNATILWDTLSDEELEDVIVKLGYNPSEFIKDDGTYVVFESLENYENGEGLKKAFIEYAKNPKTVKTDEDYLLYLQDYFTGYGFAKAKKLDYPEYEEIAIGFLSGYDLSKKEKKRIAKLFHDTSEFMKEEKPSESKYNKPEYKYYTVNENNKICSGHEYKEDAVKSRREILEKGKHASIYSLRDLKGMGIDPDDNGNWWVENLDTDFIKSIDEVGYDLESTEDLNTKYSMLRILENALRKETNHINKYLVIGSKASKETFNESKSKLEKILEQISVIINK